MELIVYRDDNYATAWVPRELSKKITDFLIKKDFTEYNAEDLARWMEKCVDENRCCQSLHLVPFYGYFHNFHVQALEEIFCRLVCFLSGLICFLQFNLW
jgi:hypothetical protein